MGNKCFLTVSNSPYVSVAENLVKSAEQYHPEILFEFYGINLTENNIIRLNEIHNNIKVYNTEKYFDDVSLEALYANSIGRTSSIKKSMERSYDILYFDGDMVINNNLNKMFEFIDDYDFVINRSRAIKSKEFRCNAGLIWIKSNKKNIDIVDEWQDITIEFGEDGNPETGLAWYSEQHAMDKMIDKYHFREKEITYSPFSEQHLSEFKEGRDTLIVHNKGPRNKPDSYPGNKRRLRAREGSKLDKALGIKFR